ncbi:MAG TPA: hypothetical protein ENI31_01155 [Candidatus Omnitrophica bacterium]|nr:hypothetical protein [Candidatus Omnitrophota bacterium]
MYLKEVEIFGFKSFPDKTTLKFESGITVIVGPNGCGKSNVLDAIRWALGEQSPKSLRGTKMEDVIFNGTQNRLPLNYAEVTLLFSNEDKALNLEFEEISITRRLFRSGESEYLINNSPARLKDIQELLLPVGLGEGSYSFISQGSVENIFSYKPEEKRIIFDEASGILKFKEKKKEVLRKLEEVDNNLLRIEDIITEVKRQKDSLHRQVERARKYQEIYEELKVTERKIAILKIKELNKEKEALLNELNNLNAQDKEKESLLKELREKIQMKEKELENLRNQVQLNNSQVFEISSEISGFEHRIESNKKMITELQNRLENIKRSSALYSERKVQQQERIKSLKKELGLIDNNFLEKKNKIEELSKEIEKKLEENRRKALFIKEANQKILSLEEERVSFSNSLIDIQSQVTSLSSRKKRLLVEVAKSETEVREFEVKFSEIEKQVHEFQVKFESFKKDRKELLSKIENCKKEIDKLTEEKLGKEKELAIISSQLEFLKELRVRYEEFPQTQDITIILDKEISFLPSVILAHVDKDSLLGEGFPLKIRTQARIIPQKVEEMTARLYQLKEEIEALQNQLDNNFKQLSFLEEELRSKEEAFREEEKEFSRVKEIEKNSKETLERLKEEKSLVEIELKDTQEELNTLFSREEQLKSALSERDSRLKELEHSIGEAQEIIKRNEIEIKNLEIEITRLNTEIISLEEDKKSKQNTLEIFLKDLESLESEIANLNKESLEIEDKITSSENENQDFLKQIENKEKERDSLKESIEKLKSQQEDLFSEKQTISEESELVQKELEEIRETAHQLRLKIQNLDFNQSKVVSDLQQLYSVELNLEELDSVEESLPELQTQEETLKRRLKYLGTVNLASLEEYKELEERFNFLNTQRQDLLSSKEALKKAMNKIKKTSSEKFIEAFQKIREEFKSLFRFLFGGGKAEIYLLDESDPLESGIDIIVQPPGKKLQSVSLLSGGEKALTAIALIFAIFKFKPSALCILDEIDAPLDEANVDRFNYLLSEFAENSQFIIISHNKKTISKASVLYGVTMQEQGVSKIVSVKFTETPVSP